MTTEPARDLGCACVALVGAGWIVAGIAGAILLALWARG